MFIFYDTETSGLNKDYSQVLQIALVFTDDNLNVLSSKKVECRRSPWVVPSPGALLTTGFTPDDLKKSKNSHYEMMQEVDEWIRSQYMPVIFSGYNTLGYDEPVLAQNLHQNLLDPGLTTMKSPATGEANGRSDIMVLVKAVAMYMPEALKLDKQNDFGSASLSLINVAQQNGVVLGADDAHDAMNDVKATIGVAKVIRKAAPQIWDQMTKLATVAGVDEFMAQNKVFTHSFMAYGKARSAVVTNIATRDGDASEIMFDLSVDPAKYLKMSVDELADCMKPQNAKYHPFRHTPKDGQPILMPMDMSDRVIPAKFDDKTAEARADLLKADADFAKRVSEAAARVRDAAVKPVQPHLPETLIDVEASAPVKVKLTQWLKEFNNTQSWADAAKMVVDFPQRFEEELKTEPHIRRFAKFAGRIVFEAAPEELSAEKQDLMRRHVASRVLNPDLNAPYMTVAKARKELEQIEQERGSGKAKWQEVTDTQIRSLKLYYTSIEKEYAPYHNAPKADVPPQHGGDKPPLPYGGDKPPSNDDSYMPPQSGMSPRRSANNRFRP
ncbi:MAG: exonuclease domain-containing protein [Alphaproteobacteria bacterium]|nr:exonuclease domain-containing protein [Alphaproteobacteria bacterium]